MKQNKTRVRLSPNEDTATRLQNEAEFLSQRLKRPMSSGVVVDAILAKMSLGNWVTLRAQLREFDFEGGVSAPSAQTLIEQLRAAK
jgi:hypothetical protein